MKNQYFKLAIFLPVLTGLVVGCGKEQDPTKESKYDSVRDVVPAHPEANQAQRVLTAPYAVHVPQSDLTFTQGEAKTVEISVLISPYVKEQVNYSLVLEDKSLEKLGARFAKKGPDKWELSWQPKTDVLSSVENDKKFQLNILFVLSGKNSATVVNAFAGIDLKTEAVVTLQKSHEQPIIRQEFEIIPKAPLNPDKRAKIQFKVETSAVDPKENIELHLSRGPESPSNELLAIDGVVGSRQDPEFVKVFDGTKGGRRVVLYEMEFDSGHYVDYVLRKIYETHKYRNLFASGKITDVESEFYVTAYDKYNKTHSAELKVNFKVNLSDRPGKVLIDGDESLEASRGGYAKGPFFVSSTDERSQVKIMGLSINKADVELSSDSGSLDLGDGTTVALNCNNGTDGLNRRFHCKVGGCYKRCSVTATTTCESTKQNIPVEIKVQSELGGKVDAQSLLYVVKVNDKMKQCEAPARPANNSGDTK